MPTADRPSSPSPSRWVDRGIGAAIGVAVTAIVLWPDDPPPAPVTTAAPAVVDPPAQAPDLAATAEPDATTELANVEPTPTPAATSSEGTDSGGAEEATGGSTDDDTGDDSRESTGEPTADHGKAPEIPITVLPGSKFLRRSAEFDVEKDAWVVIQTVRVNAPAYQVQGYYEKALADLGIRVRSVEEPPNDKFKHRATIKGRAGGNVVQITVRQEAAQMRTTARIIWRVDAGSRVTG